MASKMRIVIEADATSGVAQIKSMTAAEDSLAASIHRTSAAMSTQTAAMSGGVSGVSGLITQFSKFSTMLMSLGAATGIGAAAHEFVSFTKEIINSADEMQRMSDTLGISASILNEYRHAVTMADTDMGSFSAGIIKMQKAISEASVDLKGGPAEAIRRLGLDVQQLRGLWPEEQFEAIADAISKLGNQADRTRVTLELFGRGGAALAPLLNLGSEGIRQYREETKRLGTSLSDDVIAKLAGVDDELKRVTEAFRGLKMSMMMGVAGGIGPGAGGLTDLIAGFTRSGIGQGLARAAMPTPGWLPMMYNLFGPGGPASRALGGGSAEEPPLKTKKMPPWQVILPVRQMTAQIDKVNGELHRLESAYDRHKESRDKILKEIGKAEADLEVKTAAIHGRAQEAIRNRAIQNIQMAQQLGEITPEEAGAAISYEQRAAEREKQDRAKADVEKYLSLTRRHMEDMPRMNMRRPRPPDGQRNCSLT